jgi:mono/diheme cytochrome c family protein
MRHTPLIEVLASVVAAAALSPGAAADLERAARFHKAAEPIVAQYCVGCHNSELKKGGIVLDAADSSRLLQDKELWQKALRMVRAGLMPPKGRNRPSSQEVAQLAAWVKHSVFGIDPAHIDPGRVTLRRLNRTEYKNTIRALMGVDFDTDAEFPADDTGYGFDNIGDVLTLSPLLLEKYVDAARSVVTRAVPMEPWAPAEKQIAGPLVLSYYKAATSTHGFSASHAGRYQLVLDLTANDRYVDGQFDYNKCRLVFKADGKALLSQEFVRQGGKAYRFEFAQDWSAGKHDLTLELQSLTPGERQVRSLRLDITAVTVRGPLDRKYFVRPANYERFFPGGVPADPQDRLAYARNLLRAFATRAFRRPVDEQTVDRLVRLTEAAAADRPGQAYEGALARAMTVVLASPHFLFREEDALPTSTERYPLVDEYALASRLSYFLWASIPDTELFRLARENKLRQNLPAQVTRMLADKRSNQFVRNFTGQWLQARDIDTAEVDAFAVLSKEQPPDPEAQKRRQRIRELRRKAPESLTPAEKKELEEAFKNFGRARSRFAQFDLNKGDLRHALRQETELTFDHVLRNDRSMLELLESDYTFLNERLAKFYGIDGVTGPEMRKVTLPANSPRGGILTQGTALIVTSNPDRTSPVKRGLYILENIIGMPPPPPPPDIPALEEAAAAVKGKPPTLREALKLHREAAMCASCHNRMDPLGLAFENFNALGRWRDKELNQPIEPAGKLLTGESFHDVRELKHVLATERHLDFYRCIAEKMFIFALGRGLEVTDTETVDDLVDKLEASKGRPSVLIRGIIDSPAFQRCRRPSQAAVSMTGSQASPR